MFFIDIRNKVGDDRFGLCDGEYYFSQDGRNDDGFFTNVRLYRLAGDGFVSE